MFTGQRGPEHYKVQKGDTLVSIAAAYDVPVETLARVNRLRTSAHVSPGRVLVLPEPTAPVVVAAAPPAPAPRRRRRRRPGRARSPRRPPAGR